MAEGEMRNEEKERELQRRIFESPTLLPGFDGPVVAAEEVPVRRAGSVDLVVIDAAGQIAIVECKRATNPESRRWVIGQVFEYTAGLWKLGYSDFERLLAARGAELTNHFKDAAGWDEATFDEMTEGLKEEVGPNGRLPQQPTAQSPVLGGGPTPRSSCGGLRRAPGGRRALTAQTQARPMDADR
jgi:hypothetical protein